MTEQKILKQLKNKEINCEQALESLAKIGICLNLLNDDNGHWAVSCDGMQNVPLGDEPEDIQMVSIVVAEDWKESIYDALIWILEK